MRSTSPGGWHERCSIGGRGTQLVCSAPRPVLRGSYPCSPRGVTRAPFSSSDGSYPPLGAIAAPFLYGVLRDTGEPRPCEHRYRSRRRPWPALSSRKLASTPLVALVTAAVVREIERLVNEVATLGARRRKRRARARPGTAQGAEQLDVGTNTWVTGLAVEFRAAEPAAAHGRRARAVHGAMRAHAAGNEALGSCAAARGSLTLKRAPSPGRLRTSIWPAWAVTRR